MDIELEKTFFTDRKEFIEDYQMYNSIKNLFPKEYVYGIYENRDGCKKYIVRFFKEHHVN